MIIVRLAFTRYAWRLAGGCCRERLAVPYVYERLLSSSALGEKHTMITMWLAKAACGRRW